MGIQDWLVLLGVTAKKNVGIHLRNLVEHTKDTTTGIDVSILMHRIFKGGMLDLDVLQDTADYLHHSSTCKDLPDQFFLALDKTLPKVFAFMRETLQTVPFVVFDGKAPPVKADEKESRMAKCKESYRLASMASNDQDRRKHLLASLYMTYDMTRLAISICKREGVGYCVAVGEADVQLAHLMNTNKIQVIVTEDSDFIVHCIKGKIVFGLIRQGIFDKLDMDAQPNTLKKDGTVKTTSDTYDMTKWDRFLLILFAAMLKCDYGKMVPNIGQPAMYSIVEHVRLNFNKEFVFDYSTWISEFKTVWKEGYKLYCKRGLGNDVTGEYSV